MRSLRFFRDDSWRNGVDFHREVLFAFGSIDLRICRRVHDDIGTLSANYTTNRVPVDEVECDTIGHYNVAERL